LTTFRLRLSHVIKINETYWELSLPTDALNSTITVGETIRSGALKQPSSFAETSKKSAERTQFQSLDFLRIIASLMIVIFHAHSIASKNSLSHGEHFFPLLYGGTAA